MSNPTPDKTLHKAQASSCGTKARSALGHLFCPHMGDMAGASQQLSDETQSLLRTRLRASSILFMVTVALFFVRGLVLPGLEFEAAGLLLLLLLGAAAFILYRPIPLSLTHLRILELVIFGSVALRLYGVYFTMPELIAAQGHPDPAGNVIHRAVAASVLLAAAYGMFIPNTWRRAAIVSTLLVASPIVVVLLRRQSPLFQQALQRASVEEISYVFSMLALGVFLAAFGSHVIHAMRKQVVEAREMGLYRLKEKIGAGGMGEVWKAEHELLTRPAAIKLIRPAVLASQDGSKADVASRRFEREAQTTASLRSPHTIELYDFGVTKDGTFYYVMEYLDGLGLDELIQKFGPVPAERAIHILQQATQSLAEAHRAGLIHRDIKPSNLHLCVMGMEHDFVKVLDFGLVTQHSATDADLTKLTSEHTTTGTPAYMPPEMALGDRPVDERADVYALGCVAYWLLTGKQVFEGSSPVEIIVEHVKSPPPLPSDRTDNHIPAQLVQVIMSCLEKDPAARPRSMVELGAALAACPVLEPWNQQRAAEWWQRHMPRPEAERYVA